MPPPEINKLLEVSGVSLRLHHVERDDVAGSRIGNRLPKGAISLLDR